MPSLVYNNDDNNHSMTSLEKIPRCAISAFKILNRYYKITLKVT